MSIQIRKGVFETNSSSSHSLTVAAGDLVEAPFDRDILRSGIVVASLHEYGWEWRRYYQALNKLHYLFTQVTQGNLPDVSGDQNLTEALLEDKPQLALLAKVVKDHTGCVLRFTHSSGYIDHDSVGVGMELFRDEEALKNFLFNPSACVQTGNDNDPPPFEIGTDRGQEFFYADKVATAPEDYVSVSLAFTDRRLDSLRTPKGAVLTDAELQPELYARLLQEAVVVSAHYDVIGRWDHFEHRSPSGQAARALNGLGMKMSPVFWADHTWHKKDGYEEDLSLTAKVPADLAEALGALPKTPQVLLDLVAELLAYEHRCEWLPGATYLDAKQRAKAERELKAQGKKVDRLFNEAGRAGVLF